MRTFNAYLISPALAITGFRFSKDYRWGISFGHRMVYRLVSTVVANLLADVISPPKAGE